MKTLKLTLTALFFTLLAGCAGLTDATLEDTDTQFNADDTQIINMEAPDFIRGGDQEDMIDVRPRDRYQDRY
ncbi:MAG: hypothetical protein JJU37_03085 [Balneolaceae bacterium]|nr:hypothetical protein [Balneolaceae bacterium]